MKSTIDELAMQALDSFEKNCGIKLAQDDNIYIWVYVNNAGEVDSVELNTLNHSPEGVFCTVRDLYFIESWWDHSWSYLAEE